MTNAFIALIAAIGVSGWVYSKINRSTGGNNQSSLTVAAVAALFTFALMLFVLSLIPG